MELKLEFKRSRKGLPVFADSAVAKDDEGLGFFFFISGGPTRKRRHCSSLGFVMEFVSTFRVCIED